MSNTELPVSVELLKSVVGGIRDDAHRAIEELAAAARRFDSAGVTEGVEFLFYALGRIDSARMGANELRDLVNREIKAVRP